jgi:glycerol-3-phosphate dehydrogenase
MKRYFGDLKQKTYDLIVIGGGIIGAGIIRDAALRGLDTLLVEKEDFACGTTSSSTRLIHGGLRYLRMLDFKLVWQDLHEREVLLHIAPHLVDRLAFIIPLLRSEPLYCISLPFGLYLYDILASGKSLPSRKYLSRKKTLSLDPALSNVPDLVGSYLFYDCQARYMERLCLENALSAAGKNACILNHTEATGFLLDGNAIKGINLRDNITGHNYMARGRMVINAAGPGADLIWNKVHPGRQFDLRRTKGIHLVTRELTSQALFLFAKSDGRVFFVIPWNGYSLIGTTDTDYSGDLDKVSAEYSDVDYLVSETCNYFSQFTRDDIYYTMAGLRPLVATGEKKESDTSRAHKLIDHQHQDGVMGLISILGGKITAYRAIAEEAVDLVCKKLLVNIRCITAQTPLPGAPAVDQRGIIKIAREKELPLETISYLAGIYGSRLASVLAYVDQDNRLVKNIIPGYPDIFAQIRHAVIEEEALTVSDFLLRRSTLGLNQNQGQDAVESVAQEMALLLGWNNQEKQKQIQEYRDLVAISQKFRKGAI